MSKSKIVLVFCIFLITACGASKPTAQPSTPTALVTIEPTQTQTPMIAATQEQPQIKLPQTADQVVRVSLADAKRGYDNHSAIFVDARTQAAYASGHIKGALYFGDFELMAASPSFDKSQWIITYCT